MAKVYTFDEATVSDLHKDVYGHRPSVGFWGNWNLLSDDDKQKEWDSLIIELEYSIEIEKRIQNNAVINFEERIEKAINLVLGSTRQDAIRIIIQAEDIENDVKHYGHAHLEYHFGLPFGYIKSKEV